MIDSNRKRLGCHNPAEVSSAADDWQVFGVGSPHGDDQVGWLLARLVAESLDNKAAPQILQTPSELLIGDELQNRVIICDGCRSGLPLGTLRLMSWPNSQIKAVGFAGSHDLGLPIVLELLDRMQRLPAQVWLWTIEIGAIVPGTQISSEVLTALSPDEIRRLAHRELPAR